MPRWPLFAVAFLAACAHLKAPEKGGAPWLLLETAHVSVRTDLDERDARGVIGKIERMQAGKLRGLWGGEVSFAPRAQFVVFRADRELWSFGLDPAYDGGWGGYHVSMLQAFTLDDEAGRPVYVLANPGLITSPEVGEVLTDAVLRPVPERLPAWLARAAWVFLGDAELDGDALRIRGRSKDAARALANGLPVPVSEVHDWRSASKPNVPAEGWLLLHYLRAKRPAALFDYVARLRRGEPERAAFAAAIGDIPAAELTTHLESIPTAELRVPVVMPDIAVSTVPPADVHALWAAVHHAAGGAKKADAELKIAESLEPGNVSARLLAARRNGDPRAALEQVRALRTSAPGDLRPCHFIARSEQADARERLECATALRDDRVSLGLAARLLDEKNPSGALAAVQLVRNERTSASLISAFAKAQLGQCRVALDELTAAVETLPPSGDMLSTALPLLDRLERDCGAQSAARLPLDAAAEPAKPACAAPSALNIAAGTVHLRAAVDEKGHVGEVSFTAPAPGPLRAGALRWLRECTVTPGRNARHQPVESLLEQDVVFP